MKITKLTATYLGGYALMGLSIGTFLYGSAMTKVATSRADAQIKESSE